MAEKINKKAKPASADWFVQGVLTKIGDTFDRLTGRGWKPSSSLATSELAERLKALVDAEARETPEKRKYVPHSIKLKMQWDKFSTDSENALKKLEHELLTSLIDHINDRRYYTYFPISLSVKPDYFTSGVKLFASFDETNKDESEASLNVTVPSLQIDLPESAQITTAPPKHFVKIEIRFATAGNPFSKIYELESGTRLSVGRTKESDIAVDDPSVSKMHASLLLSSEGNLMLADTGSTNGTFISGERIAYGKAMTISTGQKLRFGTVDVEVDVLEQSVAEGASAEDKSHQIPEDTYRVGEFDFSKKPDAKGPANAPEPTLPGIPMPSSQILKPIRSEPAATEPYIKIDDQPSSENGAKE